MALRPLIAIIGTTGTGKSKLAIQLAKRLGRCSVINADAMQVYAGMDIITNKVSESEMDGVEHHLMGFRQPGQQYNVTDWVSDAIDIIDDIHSQNKVPIVVGGTSYWIQHLVFPGSVKNERPATPSEPSPALAHSISQLPPELLRLFTTWPDVPPSAPDDALVMYKLLNALDPTMGARWHWRDTRKVHRSLCIIKESGRLASEHIAEQAQTTYAPRYRPLFLWLYASPPVIYPRLDARVDEMLTRGLVDEVRALLDIKTSGVDHSLDFTTGIYQSIGYREFCQYLMDPEDTKAFDLAVEKMKTSTRQYAKRQVSWIRNKLLPEVRAAGDEFSSYLLDVSDIHEGWVRNVQEPANRIVDGFLDETLDLDPRSLSDVASEMLAVPEKEINPLSRLEARKKRVCDVCTVDAERPVLIDEEGWDVHRRSRVHRRFIQKTERRGQKEEYFRSLAANSTVAL